MGLLDRVKASQAAAEEEKEVLAGAASTSMAAAAGSAVMAPPRPRPAVHATAAPSGVVVELAPRQAAARQASVEPEKPAATPPAPVPAGGGSAANRASASWVSAKAQIHARLVEKYADEIDVTDRDGVRKRIAELVDEHLRVRALPITRTERERLIDSLFDDVVGLGPLEGLLRDTEISEIMINHPKQIYIERKGRTMLSNVTFEDERQLRQVIDRVVSAIGRRVDESTPMCDARLKDGSRVNVIIPPLALKGPCMTIRKFSKEKLTSMDLVDFGSATPEVISFLQSAVKARMNILVSGGTGSGKTTLLNILSSFVPEEERIITCEDAAELQLHQEHVVTLESRPANVEGKGAIPIRDLVKNSLRMRPDRIIVGEVRGGEALDMLQAMNTGHDGSMSTLHANSPHDALNRLETLVLMAGSDLPSRAIREQIASAVQIVVQQQRLRGGPRKIVSVAEITGITDGEIQFQELFVFKHVGVDPDGKAVGYHTATGVKPMRAEHFAASGEELAEELFRPSAELPQEKLY
jgi:pilus assembly protein CpaF